MALHPQIEAILAAGENVPAPTTIEEVRANYARTSLTWVGEAEEVATVEDVAGHGRVQAVDVEGHGPPDVVRHGRPIEPERRQGGALVLPHQTPIDSTCLSWPPMCRAAS